MKKFAAIGEILGNKKVAFNKGTKEVMWSNGKDFVSRYDTGYDTHEISNVDYYTNRLLNEEGWEVTDEGYASILHFKFPIEMVQVSPIQMVALLEKNDYEVQCEVLCGITWEPKICKSVYVGRGGDENAFGCIEEISANLYWWRVVRVKKGLYDTLAN